MTSALKGLSDEMDIFREGCQIKSECSLRVLIVFKWSKVLQTISAHTVYCTDRTDLSLWIRKKYTASERAL